MKKFFYGFILILFCLGMFGFKNNKIVNREVVAYRYLQGDDYFVLEVDPSVFSGTQAVKSEGEVNSLSSSDYPVSNSTSNVPVGEDLDSSVVTRSEVKSYSNRTVIKKISNDQLRNRIVLPKNKNYGGAQAISVVLDQIIVTRSSSNGNGKKTFVNVIDKKTKKVVSSSYYSFYHAGGMTYNSNTNMVYVKPDNRYQYVLGINQNNLIQGKKKDLVKVSLEKYGSGLAYDKTTNQYYSNSYKEGLIHVMDGNFGYLKSFPLIDGGRGNVQDMGVYQGIGMVMYYQSQSANGIDFYRLSDGAYLGTYELPVKSSDGKKLEIESIDYEGEGNQFLVLMNVSGTSREYIYTMDINIQEFQ